MTSGPVQRTSIVMRSSKVIEHGRRPFVISLGLAGTLALFTAIRFVLMVHILSPTQYGRLNIFLTLANVLPLVMNLGIPWQVERIALKNGGSSTSRLVRSGWKLNLAVSIPTLIVVGLIIRPFADGQLGILTVATWAVAVGTSMTTIYAQILLGLGHRSSSALMLFIVNGGLTLALIPGILLGHTTVPVIMATWGALAIATCGVAHWITVEVGRHVPERSNKSERVSISEGLRSVFAQAGPWVMVFVVRDLLGLYVGSAAVAVYAISSTVTD
ncbi:MAG TPA: hypothetical protein VNU19_00490, partial [Candidatus Acidoferrum sp.]|nr:hypothetical protein [Candidatus Acidoferrum sp.]